MAGLSRVNKYTQPEKMALDTDSLYQQTLATLDS